MSWMALLGSASYSLVPLVFVGQFHMSPTARHKARRLFAVALDAVVSFFVSSINIVYDEI